MARQRWKEIALLTIAMLATAGPWYIRNVIVFRFIIPPTMWTAQHTLGTFLIMSWEWKYFSLIGVLYTIAIGFCCGAGHSAGWIAVAGNLGMLMVFSVPFYGLWWLLASYDARFLVMLVPLLAVMAGLMLDELLMLLRKRAPLIRITRAQWLAIFCVLILASFSLRKTVNYKATILSQPFMSDAEKHRVVLGGMYDLAVAVNQLPAAAGSSAFPRWLCIILIPGVSERSAMREWTCRPVH